MQEKLMRNADIRTTMSTYGDVVTDELVQASREVAGLVIQGPEGGEAYVNHGNGALELCALLWFALALELALVLPALWAGF
jgi:hypothetical protein